MTVSMRIMSAGTGYRYLLHSVAAGDGNRDLSTPLTRYYADAGCPPGRWLGAGLTALNTTDAQTVRVGDVVSELQLQRLIGHGAHPVTGEQLGHPYYHYQPPNPSPHPAPETEDSGSASTAKPPVRRKPVAGFDYTFSVHKSVSVLWGLADAGTQELLVATHHAAVAEVITFMEGEVVATRTGAASNRGAVVQADVAGVLATGFDHWDSRAGDPQLHTHVVVSNKVATVTDGRWRAIDSRPMHAATVAVSELYNAVLADKLTATFGLDWQQRDRGRSRNPGWELDAIPEALISEFSTRATAINATAAELVDQYTKQHGHQPPPAVLLRLRQQATLATRPDKQLRSMTEMTDDWRRRAETIIGTDALAWTHHITQRTTPTTATSWTASGAAMNADHDDGRTLVGGGGGVSVRRRDDQSAPSDQPPSSDRYTVVASSPRRPRHAATNHLGPTGGDGVMAPSPTAAIDDDVSTPHQAVDEAPHGRRHATTTRRHGRSPANTPSGGESPRHAAGRRDDDATLGVAVDGGEPPRGRHIAVAAPPDPATAAPSRRAPLLRADDVPAAIAEQVGAAVLANVADKRSTWTRWNLHAEASRQLMGWRFASTNDRNAFTTAVVAAAEASSLQLTTQALATPVAFRRADGTSRFRPRHQALFTSQQLLDAEATLLELSQRTDGARIAASSFAAPGLDVESAVPSDDHRDDGSGGVVLGDDQAEAVAAIATSGRVVDVLVGPAGAGKTTTLAALRRAWESEHGQGSVAGLAPSATAAAVLAEELGIATENTAKWLYDHEHRGQNLAAHQLVIVDEASLAGTFTLQQIASHAADVGAKLLLVGDYAQLQSVSAGGAFALLVAERADAPVLTDINRFRADWEKAASLQLRHANPEAIDAYERHQRVNGGAGHSSWGRRQRQCIRSPREVMRL